MATESNAPALQGIERTLFPLSSASRRPTPASRFLRNTWYVAMFSSELAEGRLVHRTIMNEPIVFYRRENGGIAAITDRCPHRFVPLSMGKLLPGDRVQCIYQPLSRSRFRAGPPGRGLARGREQGVGRTAPPTTAPRAQSSNFTPCASGKSRE